MHNVWGESVHVGSPAGIYTAGTPFFRYIVRLVEMGLPLAAADEEAVEMLAAIPHAFADDNVASGRGWRIVPPSSSDDWPVLEVTPQRFRRALETARRILWENTVPVGISAADIVRIEDEIEHVFVVLQRAEAAGLPVNVSYIA